MNLLREKLRAQGHHRLWCSDAPDMTGVNEAAKASAELGKEALDWYKQQYADGAADRANASELAKTQANLQNQLSQQQLDVSQQERDRYLTTFVPIENKIAQDAQGYDTPARREAAAAAATADVEQQLSGQRQATTRAMERAGALPTSGRVAAMQGMMDLGAAKLKAGAANTARQQVETVGAAKMADAAAMGRGAFTNQGTTAALALQAGNSATANGTTPVNVNNSGAAVMGQGFTTALAGQGQAGSLYNDVANAQLKADATNASVWSSLGSVGGSMLAKSDVAAKKGFEPVDGEEALEAVNDTPVEAWNYKSEADGAEKHVGPMAQRVQITMGDRAAPKGKSIDLVTMNGVAMAAIQELSKKLSRVAAAAGIPEPA